MTIDADLDDLMDRYNSCDREALDALCAASGERLYQILLGKVVRWKGNAADAWDIEQITWLNVQRSKFPDQAEDTSTEGNRESPRRRSRRRRPESWVEGERRIPRFNRYRATFRNWLAMLAYTEVKEWWRRRRRQPIPMDLKSGVRDIEAQWKALGQEEGSEGEEQEEGQARKQGQEDRLGEPIHEFVETPTEGEPDPVVDVLWQSIACLSDREREFLAIGFELKFKRGWQTRAGRRMGMKPPQATRLKQHALAHLEECMRSKGIDLKDVFGA
ncbi:MAG: hypothetical protein HY727_07880 [Candidatus Rokubacteria bacterium]|nr:hypothetical protein [Candidatus Rokubacteria bacterium]